MAEQREKAASFLLRIQGKTQMKIDLYSASEWPEHTGRAEKGLWRLRIDGRWVCLEGEKYTWFNWPGVLSFLEKEFGAGLGINGGRAAPPNMPKGSLVRTRGRVGTIRTTTATDPIQALDGRWYVGVCTYPQGLVMRPVSELELIKVNESQAKGGGGA